VAAGSFSLSRADRKRIAEAITAAERTTSGEIVVRVVPSCPPSKGTPSEQALREFQSLGLEKTRDRTGVLLFIAAEQHAIEVLGDVGIHAKVPDGFWDGVVASLSQAFKADRFADGICDAVSGIGAQLAKHFPPRPDDANELPNRPVVG